MQRVATHATTGISCYNPLQLPFFEEDGGAKIHFACTVTSSCASSATRRSTAALIWYRGQDCDVAIPKYEYNNVVFAIDTAQLQVIQIYWDCC
jgi:hypothetical protein